MVAKIIIAYGIQRPAAGSSNGFPGLDFISCWMIVLWTYACRNLHFIWYVLLRMNQQTFMSDQAVQPQ